MFRPGPAKNRALITGISGQDGAYLAAFLLSKGYHVLAQTRTGSDLWRLKALGILDKVEITPFSLKDVGEIRGIFGRFSPQEVYHLAAESSVFESFKEPMQHIQREILHCNSLLEVIRQENPDCRLFNASSAEIFGSQAEPFSEVSQIDPKSPYGAAKACSYQLTRTYRTAYNLFACSGILFNHESPLRSEAFVTRKITRAFAQLKSNAAPPVSLGNLDSRRDWGYAPEYVEAMWRMLQIPAAQDFVLATGEAYSVREFCNHCAAACGVDLEWHNSEGLEWGSSSSDGQCWVESRRESYRLLDAQTRVGDAAKAAELLEWKPTITAPRLAATMIESELERELQGSP